MYVKVLGPLELTMADRPVRLAGQRQRALLAALILNRGKVVPVERLVEIIWDITPPATARTKVQAHVSALRQAIGDSPATSHRLLTQPPGYSLCPEDMGLDLSEFEMLRCRARSAYACGKPTVAVDLFASALALWRGGAFADVDAPLIRAAAEAIDERRLLTVEAKAEAEVELGECESVAAEVPAWLTRYPFRERLRGSLMMALYRLGCRADALAVYRHGRQLMVTELGLEPGQSLRELHQRILADDWLLPSALGDTSPARN
jgi:DNA-binding SARP family transcriptional activator